MRLEEGDDSPSLVKMAALTCIWWSGKMIDTYSSMISIIMKDKLMTVLTQWDAWQIEYDSEYMAVMHLQLETWCWCDRDCLWWRHDAGGQNADVTEIACDEDMMLVDRMLMWQRLLVMKTLKYVNSLWYTYDDDDDAYLYYMMMIMLHAMMMHFYTLWWTQRWRCMISLEDDCKDMIGPWCLKDLVDDNDAYLMHTPWRSQPVTKWRRHDKLMAAATNWAELDDLAGLQQSRVMSR